MARVQKVKQILTENLLPEKAEFGTVFVCRDTQQVWFTARNGDVLNLHALLAPMGSSYSIRTATNGNALDVYVTSHGATQEVAILSGLAVTTTDLFATHSIVV